MITVVFSIDLTSIQFGKSCSTEQSRAIAAIRDSLKNTPLTGSTFQDCSEVALVLALPDNEKTLGLLIYWCDFAKIPYKTLWLNAVSEWRDGKKQ